MDLMMVMVMIRRIHMHCGIGCTLMGIGWDKSTIIITVMLTHRRMRRIG